MAPPQNQTNVAQCTILATEISTGNVLVNRSFAPSLLAAQGIYGTYLAPPGSTAALPFPAGLTTAYNVYIRNLATTVLGSVVTFNILFSGNSTPQVVTLFGGDVWLYWSLNNSGTILGQGVSAINLLAAAGSNTNASFEYFIGG